MKTHLNLGLAFIDAYGSLRVSIQLMVAGRRASTATADYVCGAAERFICSDSIPAHVKAKFRAESAECATYKTVKEVSHSYYSSPNAEAFGFKDSGCWTVSLGLPGKPAHAVMAFGPDEEARARDYASRLPFAWSAASLALHPELASA